MSLPEITSRDGWLVARRALLAKEKEHTRRMDALNAERRRLPMVAVGKRYEFEGPDGQVTLAGLFDGRRQLVLQHVMYGPDWDSVCPGCTAGLDELSPGLLRHLGSRDTTFAAASRAPFAKIAGTMAEKGWTMPWYSSFGSDFNYDFYATVDRSVRPVEYNYRPDDGDLGAEPTELPGVSCFLRDGDTVYHTYSTFARGTDQLGSAYSFLDLTALGRSEEWEQPRGRVDKPHGADPAFTD